jgi:hypothetical protein
MHPFFCRYQWSPSSDTAYPQRAPLPVLPMHMPTAVLPFVADAGLEVVRSS